MSPCAIPSSICFCVQPTVAISGWVKMFELTLRSSIGLTASPIAWNTAVRPCMRRDGGERQEVGAVAGRVDVRDGGARDPVDPDVAGRRSSCTPASSSPMPGGVRARADGHQAVAALDRRGRRRGSRPRRSPCATTDSARDLREHLHAVAREDVLDHAPPRRRPRPGSTWSRLEISVTFVPSACRRRRTRRR